MKSRRKHMDYCVIQVTVCLLCAMPYETIWVARTFQVDFSQQRLFWAVCFGRDKMAASWVYKNIYSSLQWYLELVQSAAANYAWFMIEAI